MGQKGHLAGQWHQKTHPKASEISPIGERDHVGIQKCFPLSLQPSPCWKIFANLISKGRDSRLQC